MTKMSAPKMDVIRFGESDVIVASNRIGKTLTVSGSGNDILFDATFTIGDGDPWSSSQVYNNNDFANAVNAYLGDNYFASNNDIFLRSGDKARNINKIAEYDTSARLADHTSIGALFMNNTFTWNGSSFTLQ